MVKIILVVVLLLVVLGTLSVAGIFYALHLASRKAHEFSRQVRDNALLSSVPSDSGTASALDGSVGNLGPGACRLLSKEDVGRAIGVAIVVAILGAAVVHPVSAFHHVWAAEAIAGLAACLAVVMTAGQSFPDRGCRQAACAGWLSAWDRRPGERSRG